jgi:PhnB protein
MTALNEWTRRGFVAAAASTAALATVPIVSATDANMHKTQGDTMTTTLTPYLLLDGTCRQAMEFYHSCFGGELTVTKVKDSPAKDFMPPTQHEKVINARLVSTRIEISASDWLRPAQTPVRGNTVCLYLSGGSIEDLKTLFEKLSEGAQVTDPLSTQFFGTYGALNDKFGVRWMFQSNSKI